MPSPFTPFTTIISSKNMAPKFHNPKLPFCFFLSCNTQRISLLILWEDLPQTTHQNLTIFKPHKNKKRKTKHLFFFLLQITPLNVFHWNSIFPASTPSIHSFLPQFVVFSSDTVITFNLSFSFIGGLSLTNHLPFPPYFITPTKISSFFYPFISIKSKLS